MHATDVNLRLSLRNLLFTTDFSETSGAALPYVLALARWYDANVFLLHTVPAEVPLPMPMEALPLALNPSWRAARQQMDKFLESNSFLGIQPKALLEQGEFWEAVSGTIRTQAIDMIVMGTHGRMGFRKLVLGSMAEQVFRQASCPVLTVGPAIGTRPASIENWKHILFATDFSPASRRAFTYALSLAEENECELTLLHMVPLVPVQQQDQVRDSAQKRLESFVPAEALPWCKPHYQVKFDFAVDGILETARQLDADVIVMGVHPARSPLLVSHLPWAAAYEVVCHAPCPVLTVRG